MEREIKQKLGSQKVTHDRIFESSHIKASRSLNILVCSAHIYFLAMRSSLVHVDAKKFIEVRKISKLPLDEVTPSMDIPGQYIYLDLLLMVQQLPRKAKSLHVESLDFN